MIGRVRCGQFVADMEKVLDTYKRPYDEHYPVVCMDESPKQLIQETRLPIPMQPGREKKQDYEYSRKGTCTIFMANEPLQGKRYVEVTGRKTKHEWAMFIKTLSDQLYPGALRITLVMDNLNTHSTGALYEVFPAHEAKRLRERFTFIFTPKHGSWLNMAEIELNVLQGQCLSRRMDTIEEVTREAKAWAAHRNQVDSVINWRFTTEDARIKLKRLYPSIGA